MNDNANQSKINSNRIVSNFFDWADTIVYVILLLCVMIVFVFRMANVDGQSMMNTLHDGDKLLVTNLFYNPGPKDIIVIAKGRYYNKPLVKRIIAVEGQTVDIDFNTGDVKVDGQVIDEPYIRNLTTIEEGGQIPVTVPKGYVFVMGDNRQNSLDSRSMQIGLIDRHDIVGKAQWRLWGTSDTGLLDFSRFGKVS